jgi:hypothetical protein
MGELSGESRRRRLYADWRLRLRKGDAHGEVCGAGILITMRHVLTCAHVVGAPDERIWVEFVENPFIEGVEAAVVRGPGSWHPPGEEERGLDVALLALRTPRPRARPALLSRDLRSGQEVAATGYTWTHESGLTLTARVSGAHGRWVQLDSVTGTVREGFSGGAVFTLPQGGRPAEVVGMTVGRREDDPALPDGERRSRSYMIPLAEIAGEVPLVRRLSRPDAWDVGLGRRLRTWFADPAEPDVKLCHIPEDSGRDRTLRHELYRAHVHYAGGQTDRDEFVEQLAVSIMPGNGRLSVLQQWLLHGGPPPAAVTGNRQPKRRVCVAVTALDRDPDPDQLIDLLVRVRRLGFRMLLAFREGSGRTWRRAQEELQNPALCDYAGELVHRLDRLESAGAASASGMDARWTPPAPTARRHAEARRRLCAAPGPGPDASADGRTARLLGLVRAVRQDIRRWEGWLG